MYAIVILQLALYIYMFCTDAQLDPLCNWTPVAQLHHWPYIDARLGNQTCRELPG